MKRILRDDPEGKIHDLMEYTDRPDEMLKDPWYTRKFDTCAEQIREGCEGFLTYVMKR